ncbi:MAG: cytochrome P450 [Hyphomonadaceae bacterium]|nr:cytochrome P450 [Hyphomonadaceae bacterium]
MLKVDFDHALPLKRDELFGWGERLRAAPTLGYSDAHGGFWIASRYDDVVSVLRDTETFICSKRITLPPQASPVPVIPLESDEPDHTFYRSVFAPLVTPKAVHEHQSAIRDIVANALEKIAARGGGDAVTDFAALIPARAMAMLFGFSDEDAYAFDTGFSNLVAAAGSGDVERQMKAVGDFKAFLEQKVEERRAAPRESDLVSSILRHEVDGRRYQPDEILGLMWSAAGGAIDTTKHAIGHAVREIGVRPHVRKALIEDPSKIPAIVDESLRLNASAFMDARYIAKDVTLSGSELREGERILLVYGWANHDERVFEDAQNLVLDRKPNRHLTFGVGIHQCLGNHLARLELKLAIEGLLEKIPNYELVEPDVSPILSGGMMWAHKSLPISNGAGRSAKHAN